MPPSTLLERKVYMMVPYIFLMLLYLLSFQPFYHLPPETIPAAITKAAPIWYLAAYVGVTPNFRSNCLAHGTRVGLVLSSIGDVCLTWRGSLFLPGMFFFGLAQLAYIYGSRSWVRRGNYPNRGYMLKSFVVCVLLYCLLFTGMESWLMAVCVMVYSALVFLMANLTLQRHLVENNVGSLYGVCGGLCFVVSDFLIGLDKWVWNFPMSEGIIMATYYVAQGAITFGVVSSARAKRRE